MIIPICEVKYYERVGTHVSQKTRLSGVDALGDDALRSAPAKPVNLLSSTPELAPGRERKQAPPHCTAH